MSTSIKCGLATCDQEFEPRPRSTGGTPQRFCSYECSHRADNARRVEERAARRIEAERRKDPAVVVPLNRMYRTVCVMCGSDHFIGLTADELRALRRLPPCGVCAGTVHLEQVLLTGGVGR